ncbi:MAG: hypothetical protein HYY46_19900 [Deltaproteobacteria bacterium]|nr:hypothetical protein [Deltaproteobacteria bacterium]
MVNVIHIINQFFAGVGGEDKAGIAVSVAERGQGSDSQRGGFPQA